MSDAKAYVFDLGWSMARASRGRLIIVSPSDSEEGFHQPAQTITICRPQDLRQLRDACDVALSLGEHL